MPTKRFNWTGINENDDGTYSAYDKRAKTRLLKELHRQGFKVRSTKIEGDGFRVSPVGSLRSTRRSVSRGYRPAVRAARQTGYRPQLSSSGRYASMRGRYVPVGGSGRVRRMGPPPRPMNYAGGYPSSNAGPTFGKRISDWAKQRRSNQEKAAKDEVERKRILHETEEKLKQDRIAKERAEVQAQFRQQETTARLQREQQEHERHEAAERMRKWIDQQQIEKERQKQVTGQ
jgi:hypothetical protein